MKYRIYILTVPDQTKWELSCADFHETDVRLVLEGVVDEVGDSFAAVTFPLHNVSSWWLAARSEP
jgi:hypothetical protein